jgi:hypothetical protein
VLFTGEAVTPCCAREMFTPTGAFSGVGRVVPHWGDCFTGGGFINSLQANTVYRPCVSTPVIRTMEWRRLTEDYAIRSRQFYEAVIRLGRSRPTEPEFLGLLDEIERLQMQCLDAGKRLRSSLPIQCGCKDADGAITHPPGLASDSL